MSLGHGIKIGTTEFDELETGTVTLVHVQQSEVQFSQRTLPTVFEPHTELYNITVEIIHNYKATQTRLDTVIADTSEMAVRYNYYDTYADGSPTDSVTCIIDPETITETYWFGERAGLMTTTLNFLQSS